MLRTNRWPLALCAGIFVASSAALALGSGRPDSHRAAASESPSQRMFRARSVPDSAEAIAAVARDPADQCIAEYALAAKRLEEGNLDAALVLLASARERPLLISPSTRETAGRPGAAPDNISDSSQLLLVSVNLCRLAERAAEEGDAARAQDLIQRSREIAQHVLETDQPTMDALMTARSIDAKTGRSEIRALRHLRLTAKALEAERRESQLKGFYTRYVLPEMVRLRAQLDQTVALISDQQERKTAIERQVENNDLISASLIRSYLAERTRLLS